MNKQAPDNTPELEAIATNGAQHTEHLQDLSSLGEASLVEQHNTTQSVKELEPLLDHIVQNTTPKDVQKIELVGESDTELAGAIFSLLKGKPGQKPTEEELKALITPLIPEPIKGEDGHSPTDDELLAIIRPLIPEAIPGADGDDGHTPSDSELSAIISPLIPEAIPGEPGQPGQPGKDGSPDTGEEIVAKHRGLPKEKRISYDELKDLPNLDTFRRSAGKGGFGQALAVQRSNSLVATDVKILNFLGAGVTVTDLKGGVLGITVTGGGGGSTVYSETPTGAINGSNKSYSTLNTINTVLSLYVNGTYIHPSDYTATGNTITFGTALDASLSGTGFTIIYS